MLTQDTNSSFVELLRNEYLQRKKRRPSYSLRGFAKALEMSPGRLSELLSQKRNPTANLIFKVSDLLDMPIEKKKQFLQVALEDSNKKRSLTPPKKQQYTPLAEDIFHAVSDPNYFAFLNLLKTKAFKNDIKWVSKRLGISTLEVRDVADRLIRLELLEVREGKWIRKYSDLSVTSKRKSPAIRSFHSKLIQRSAECLEAIPKELRDVSAIIFAANPKKLPEIRLQIQKFQRQVARLMEADAEEVYALNIQLIPMTKRSRG